VTGAYLPRARAWAPMADLSDVVLTSVPEPERRFADEHLPGAHVLGDELSSSLAKRHAGARVLAPMIHDPVTLDALDRFEGLEAVITRSDGYDHLPLDGLADRGIPAYHLGGYATESVAHHALMFALALLRRVPEAQATARGEDPRWERGHLMGRHLQDVTVGVLGVGRIGSRVAELVTGVGGRVLGHDLEHDPAMDAVDGFAWADGLDDLLASSDVLSVHVPLDETTRGRVGGDELARLPDDACLVNTARGGIVDQAAVERALDEGTLAGYALDVLPGEPEPPDLDRFRHRGRVLVTPHLAAYDERTTGARYERTGRIARATVEGRPGEVDGFRVA